MDMGVCVGKKKDHYWARSSEDDISGKLFQVNPQGLELANVTLSGTSSTTLSSTCTTSILTASGGTTLITFMAFTQGWSILRSSDVTRTYSTKVFLCNYDYFLVFVIAYVLCLCTDQGGYY